MRSMISREPKTLIILPVWGAWDWVELCLTSVADNTIPEHYDIAIIHNPNESEDAELCKQQNTQSPYVAAERLVSSRLPIDEVEVYYMPQMMNLGVSKSWNTGILHGIRSDQEYDSYLFLNSDVIVFDEWLANLRLVMRANAEVLCIQPQLTEGDLPDTATIMEACKTHREIAARGVGINGPCFLLTHNCIRRVGMFDEGYRYGFYEDSDMLMRIRERRQDPIIALKSYVHHHHAKSRTSLPNFDKYAALNKRRFERKWSVNLPASLDAKSFESLSDLRAKHGLVN